MSELTPAVQQRIDILELIPGRARDADPDRLLSWLLTGSPDASAEPRHDHQPQDRTGALSVISGYLDDVGSCLGTRPDCADTCVELMDWITDPVLRPIPRHYRVILLTEAEAEDQRATGRESYLYGHAPLLRVRSRPAHWFTTTMPEDVL